MSKADAQKKQNCRIRNSNKSFYSSMGGGGHLLKGDLYEVWLEENFILLFDARVIEVRT